MGTWILNVPKSQLEAVVPKASLRKHIPIPGGVRVVQDRVDAQGKASTGEFTVKFDGKDYPISGDPYVDRLIMKRVNKYRADGIGMKGDKKIDHIRLAGLQRRQSSSPTLRSDSIRRSAWAPSSRFWTSRSSFRRLDGLKTASTIFLSPVFDAEDLPDAISSMASRLHFGVGIRVFRQHSDGSRSSGAAPPLRLRRL